MTFQVTQTIEERLLARVQRDGECLLWIGHLTPTGYGVFKIRRKSHGAHRIAYMTWVGPIPDGYEVDHLCKVRNCVEPTHLEAVTRRENLMRSSIPEFVARRTGKCHRGHDLTELADGRRRCTECPREKIPCATCGKAVQRRKSAAHARTHAEGKAA